MRLDAARYGIKSIARRALSTWTGPPTRTLQFVRQFKHETRDPAWTILDHLHSQGPTKGNARRGLPLAHREWDFLLRAGDIRGCLDALRTRGISLDAVPFWGLAEMVAFNVQRVSHTDLMLEVAQSRAPDEPAGPLLVFAMLHLARFDHVSAYPSTVSAFLGSAHTHPDLHFNLFLQSLCLSTHPSEDAARSAVRVLEAMDERGVTLRPEVYDALLRNRFVTLQLTKYLHDRMVREGHVPTQAQLENFLRVFAREGAIHDSTAYEKMVKPLLKQSRRALRYSPRLAQYDFASQESGVSAFAYLTQLVDKDEHRRTTNILHMRQDLSRRHPHVDLPRMGVAEATTALHALAKDHSVGAKQLMRAYTRLRHSRPFHRETIASRTALIAALLRRRAYASAHKHAKRLLRSGLPLDARALLAVLQAHILAGRPQDALDVLEAHAAVPSSMLPSSPVTSKSASALAPKPSLRRARLPTAVLNDVLSALLVAKRPDILFALADAMEPLYGVRPDTRTLELVLRAAARANRLDNTFRGALAALRRRLHLDRAPSPPPKSREEAVQSLSQLAVEKYRSGVWRGMDAAEAARRVFVGMVVGGNHKGALKDVEAPAVAVRPHRDADSLLLIGAYGPPLRTEELAGEALPWPPGDEVMGVKGDAPAPASSSPTPQPTPISAQATLSTFVSSPSPPLAPTPALEAAFFAYLCLLGHMRRTPDTALALAWMRALRMRPRPRTLAVALALWAEVALEAPLVQRMMGPPRVQRMSQGNQSRGDQYARLEAWVEEWGREAGFRVPGPRTLSKWRRWLERQRGE